MKHIRIICFVAILASMSSCGAIRQTTTTRTARTFEIETDIQQMPTVADLVVDTVYVRKDTTWTNITFKSHVSKATMRDVLLGSMLEENNADVIVQPREHTETDLHHPFKQTIRMEIFGYPARYRNFRTATEEDLRILNGIDPQPVNYNTIYIGAGFQQPVIHAPEAKAITPAPKARKPKKPPFVRKPFYTTLEVGYNYLSDISDHPMYDGGHGFMVNNTYLWRAKNPHIYQGTGFGLNATFGYYYGNEKASEWYCPLYYQARFYFAERKCIPFFDFRLGAFLGGASWHNKWGDHTCFMGGLYYAAFLGMEFGKHVNIAFGTDEFFGGNTRDSAPIFSPSATVKLGINF